MLQMHGKLKSADIFGNWRALLADLYQSAQARSGSTETQQYIYPYAAFKFS